MRDDNTTSEKSIFDDRESLLKIWSEERKSRDFNASLMWENLKFFSLLISGLITANTFFLGFIFDNSSPRPSEINVGYSLVTFVLPGLIMYLSWSGHRDLKRRWNRTLEAIVHLTKLEDLLGLREFLPPYSDVFSEDTHLFERYIKDTEGFDSGQKFIDNRRTRGPNMYTHMKRVFVGLFVIGASLVAIPLGSTLYYAIF